MTKYYIEVTDLFCGEANYSWVRRYSTTAKSMQSAISKVSKLTGLHFRKYYSCSDSARYDSTSKLTCAFVQEWDDYCDLSKSEEI